MVESTGEATPPPVFRSVEEWLEYEPIEPAEILWRGMWQVENWIQAVKAWTRCWCEGQEESIEQVSTDILFFIADRDLRCTGQIQEHMRPLLEAVLSGSIKYVPARVGLRVEGLSVHADFAFPTPERI